MGGRRGQRPHHHQGALRSGIEQLATHMTKTPFHPITGDGVPDCLGHDEADARSGVMTVRGVRGNRRVVHSGCGQLGLNGRTGGPGGMHHHGLPPCSGTTTHHGTELTGPMHAGTGGQHEPSQTGIDSGRQAGATLATTGRQDVAARAGAHPGTEAVVASATTITGLEGTLHGIFSLVYRGSPGGDGVNRNPVPGAPGRAQGKESPQKATFKRYEPNTPLGNSGRTDIESHRRSPLDTPTPARNDGSSDCGGDDGEGPVPARMRDRPPLR